MPFLSPLLLEGDSWDDKARFVGMVGELPKPVSEDVAEVLFQLHRKAHQAFRDGALPPGEYQIFSSAAIGALGYCGEAGFERLKRLRKGDTSVTLGAMIRTGAAAASNLVLRYFGQAQSDSQRLEALEALCARPVRDYPPDMQKFIHAEITRFLGSDDWSTRHAAVEMATLTADEVYLPRLEELAQNDPFHEQVSTGYALLEITRYTVREKALYAIEEIHRRSGRSQLKGAILRDIEDLKEQIAGCERRAKPIHIPPEHLPEYLAQLTEEKRTLEAEVERLTRRLIAVDTLDKASVPREWRKYQIERLEKDVNRRRASLPNFGPHSKANIESQIATLDQELQALREELSRLPAP